MKTQVDSRMARSTAQGTLMVGRKGMVCRPVGMRPAKMNHDHNTEEKKCCNRKPKETKTGERYLSSPMEKALGSFRSCSCITIGHKSDYRRLIKIKEIVYVGKTECGGMRGTEVRTIGHILCVDGNVTMKPLTS